MNNQTSEKPSANAILMELVKQTRFQTAQLEELKPPRIQIRFAHYCVIGLMFAWLVTSIWIFKYLNEAATGLYGSLLLDFVSGKTFGSTVFESTEPVFVVVSRFFLGIGVSWVPLTFVVLVIDLLRQGVFRQRD